MSEKVMNVMIPYIRSTNYRTVHADGLYGGITPGGLMSMSVYSEYPQIPDQVQIAVDLASGSQRELPTNEVFAERFVECTIMISPQLALSMKLWLEDRIVGMKDAGALTQQMIDQVKSAHEAGRANPQ